MNKVLFLLRLRLKRIKVDDQYVIEAHSVSENKKPSGINNYDAPYCSTSHAQALLQEA